MDARVGSQVDSRCLLQFKASTRYRVAGGLATCTV